MTNNPRTLLDAVREGLVQDRFLRGLRKTLTAASVPITYLTLGGWTPDRLRIFAAYVVVWGVVGLYIQRMMPPGPLRREGVATSASGFALAVVALGTVAAFQVGNFSRSPESVDRSRIGSPRTGMSRLGDGVNPPPLRTTALVASTLEVDAPVAPTFEGEVSPSLCAGGRRVSITLALDGGRRVDLEATSEADGSWIAERSARPYGNGIVGGGDDELAAGAWRAVVTRTSFPVGGKDVVCSRDALAWSPPPEPEATPGPSGGTVAVVPLLPQEEPVGEPEPEPQEPDRPVAAEEPCAPPDALHNGECV